MPLTPDRRLQVRIAGALALVVGVNGLVIAALAWSAVRVLSASGRSVHLDASLPITVGALLFGAVGLVALQARYGSRTIVTGLEPDEIDGDGLRNVGGRVRRLAAQADVPLPSVTVTDRDEPGCLTVGSQRSPTIVVTTGLLAELGDDELEAALAHEIAHLANRDLPVVTAVAATVAIGDRLLERERVLRRLLSSMALLALFTGVGVVILALPILVLASIYLAVSAVARALLGVNAITLGLFSKTREYAADRGASQLTGNPAALASALETLSDNRPQRDPERGRHALDASATLGIVQRSISVDDDTGAEDDEQHWVDRWFPTPSSGATDEGSAISIEGPADPNWLERALARAGTGLYARVVAPITSSVRRLLGWRPATHPAPESRIERLRRLERRRRR